MSLSTHVLDAAKGLPAAGVAVRLERRDDGGAWTTLAEARTDDDGRVREWDVPAWTGVHRLTFDTAGLSEFFPEVTVTFTVTDPGRHHHVPLLISPFAYSTYRGS
ncbi:5-hydroxyisourate hydrolase [Actinomadura hallensis]|uniref:5-hydroxyisourate hydrolase n=1 Tax=Actinomadura hallensis TaxID=337895 RepID=A0A543IJD5_9ACTN|nr:hydroxyisourate hydrolase [Actinomadura hallensis]TQM70683.1 5-hydroxyisourate hydrolase [Actinomadura hallensis]HLV73122.1 hydroxyisourate hydrolase [Vulgatibacteraceae bacterium]